MKNITVSVDEAVYRAARVKAAEQDTSISALVKQFLVTLAEGGSDANRLAEEEKILRQRIRDFRAAGDLSRDDLHNRHR